MFYCRYLNIIVIFLPFLILNLYSLSVDEEEDDEEVYKMAGVMAQCGGLECMLNRLSGIKDFKQGRHLLTVSLPHPFITLKRSIAACWQILTFDFSIPVQVLLKLFSYCVKVKINRQQLVKPEMNTLNVMLGTLNLVSNKLILSLLLRKYWGLNVKSDMHCVPGAGGGAGE